MTLSPTPDNNGPEHAAPQPFRDAVHTWRDAGWLGTIPLPIGEKSPPPTGFTGDNSRTLYADDARIAHWLETGTYNEASRYPRSVGNIGMALGFTFDVDGIDYQVVGIDVDHYSDGDKVKIGGTQLKSLESQLGDLPDTVISSARDDGISGIRFYRTPAYTAKGDRANFVGKVHKDIEVIQYKHRYAVVWPSINPKTGTQYHLYPPGQAPDGVNYRDKIPDPTALPELPQAWSDALKDSNSAAISAIDTESTPGELADWAEETFNAGDEASACAEIRRNVRYWKRQIAGESTSHDKARDGHWQIVKAATEGHTGWHWAAEEITRAWVGDVTGRNKRSLSELRGEVFRSLTGAVRKNKARPGSGHVPPQCTCPAKSTGIAMESAGAQIECPVSDATVLTFTDATGAPDSITVAEFWQSRQVLADLYQFAKSRRCGPWAMLGNVMLRAASAIPPDVVLPPVVGGQASLNLYVAFAGNSGDGKGAATVAADDWLICDTIPYTAEAGSGEGMVKQFAYKQNQRGQPPTQINMRWSVLFDVREIDTLGAIGGRNSSTMLPILRSAYSGEALGFSYADPTKAIKLCAHRYRFCMGVGVQPKNAGTLIHDSDGGTPQRYVWLPVLDPDMPDERPSAPRALTLPNWESVAAKKKVGKDGGYTLVAGADHRGLLDTDSRPNERTEITVPEHIWAWLDRQRVEHNRGTKRIDALDAHANQTRLKVAAVLMWLDGRTDKITDDDWNLSGAVMAVSVLTRKWIEQHLSAKADEADRSIGRKQAVRDHAAGEAKSQMESEAIERVGERIIQFLNRDENGGRAKRGATRAWLGRDRDYFDDAKSLLVEQGRIEELDKKKGDRVIGQELVVIDAG